MTAVNLSEMRAALRYKRLPFWDRVLKQSADDCWIWLGGTTTDGYGRARIGGCHVYAHRHAYESLVGPIANGYTVDHLCQIKLCCNPQHMEIVTRGENARRGEKNRIVRSGGSYWASRTHCKNGHALIGTNIRLDGRTRRCLICARERSRAFRARSK